MADVTAEDTSGDRLDQPREARRAAGSAAPSFDPEAFGRAERAVRAVHGHRGSSST